MEAELKTKTPSALERAIALVGGPTSLARFITANDRRPITPQGVHQWKECPSDRVLVVERATVDPATGKPRVSRSELRPDLYPLEQAA